MSRYNTNPQSLNTKGVRYLQGPSPSYANAHFCFQEAVSLSSNYPDPFYNLGALYENGLGVGQNLIMAFNYYRRAVSLGHYEAGLRFIALKHSPTLSHQAWATLGYQYYYGNGSEQQNYGLARICFEKSLELSGSNAGSLYSLGWLYQYGQGVAINLPKARQYYQNAVINGSLDAKGQLLIMDYSGFTEDQWRDKGEVYRLGTGGVERNHFLAKICYEQAIKLNASNANSWYQMGWLFKFAHNFPRNIEKAKEYLQKAITLGHYKAQRLLLRINHPGYTADQWCQLGNNFYLGQNSQEQSYICASICYKLAVKEDPYHSNSLCNLGWLYAKGEGVQLDVAKAREYYHRAADQGHFNAKEHLLLIDNPGLNSAVGWFNLGINYHRGNQGLNRNYVLAQICFLQALQRNNVHDESLFMLGGLHHYYLNPVNFLQARQYYQDAMAHGCIYAKRFLKYVERDIVLSSDDVDAKDDKGDTALLRAAKNNFLKHCARLILMKASTVIEDKASKKYDKYLNWAKLAKIGELQSSINRLLTQLNQSPSETIVTRVVPNRGALLDVPGMLSQLNNFYQIEQIKPLLDLAKLAVRGLHNLSKRKKFENRGYDSDNDDGTEAVPEKSYLTINIDPEAKHVDNIFHLSDNEGKGSHGVYTGANAVFLGGRRNRPREAAGTFIHELTHFIANEVFDNECKPYRKNDSNLAKFSALSTQLEAKKSSLDPLLQEAFLAEYQAPNKVHQELIVRVPQIILTYEDGLQKVSTQAHELYSYYITIFLPAVIAHVKGLEARAMSGWPRDRMTAAPSAPPSQLFNFQKSHTSTASPKIQSGTSKAKNSHAFNPFS